jgi:hypothetical protein
MEIIVGALIFSVGLAMTKHLFHHNVACHIQPRGIAGAQDPGK